MDTIVRSCRDLSPRKSTDLNVNGHWKNYSNTEYKYSVQYPHDWFIVQELSKSNAVHFSSPGHPYDVESPALVSIYVLRTAELQPRWLESYTPFFAYHVLHDGDKTYLLLAHTYEEGGVMSKKTGELAVKALCDMLITFQFAD